MRCPYCHDPDDAVLDSRPLDSASVIRRRRVCKSCFKRFTTYERLEEMPLMVVKSDNRREPYDRNKLREGILRACEKRPISIDTVDLILSEVELNLKDYVMEIPSRVIGEKILAKLYEVDPVAYIRFASVYRNFTDVDSFLHEIQKLKTRRPKQGAGAEAIKKVPARDPEAVFKRQATSSGAE
jgi:transcriptional repressor NrdR